MELFPGQGPSRWVKQRSHHKIASAVLEALEPRTLLSAVVVNTPLDVTDPPGSSRVSLRDAVRIANASGTPTSIAFDKTAFLKPKTITLDGTALSLSGKQAITIAGPSAGLTISGNKKSNLFYVAAGTTATLSGLTLTNGFTFESGGAVDNSGKLTISESAITANDAGSNGLGSGGGIENEVGATLNLVNSTVSGNIAASIGGIANDGTANLTGVTVSDNSSTTVDLREPGECGGIDNGGVMTLTDSTVIGNSSADVGGGIVSGGKLTILDSTITGNSSSRGYIFDGGYASGDGGGLYESPGGASVQIGNSIIAGNTSGGTGPERLRCRHFGRI